MSESRQSLQAIDIALVISGALLLIAIIHFVW